MWISSEDRIFLHIPVLDGLGLRRSGKISEDPKDGVDQKRKKITIDAFICACDADGELRVGRNMYFPHRYLALYVTRRI